MFVCLSAGKSARYREDIIRALAMPRSSRLQFRYDQNLVAPIIRGHLSSGVPQGQKVLIAYIDQEDKSKVPEIVPCRFATLYEVVPHGSTVSLELILGECAYAEDLGRFDREISAESGNTLPRYQPDGSIKGAYWLELSKDLTTVSSTTSLADWERIVSQLASHPQFEDEKCFYTVTTLQKVGEEGGQQKVGEEGGVKVKGRMYALASDTEYDIRIYHFHPNKTPSKVRLTLTVTPTLATVVAGGSLIVDSRYDLKRTRLITARLSTAQRGSIIITRVDESTGGASTLDFDLWIEVAGTFWSTALKGVLAGILLAAPQIIAALQNPTILAPNRTTIIIAAGVFGLLAGVFSAFALKKPV